MPRGHGGHSALVLGAAFLLPHAADAVDCSQAPNCQELLRRPCSTGGDVPNACGDCFPDAVGAPGPRNSRCISALSCAVVYPAQIGCPSEDFSGTRRQSKVLPYGQCTHNDGDVWLTAEGTYAKLELLDTGVYELRQCTDSQCSANCLVLATWSPSERPFTCRSSATDSFFLSDGCTHAEGDVSLNCGQHPGLLAEKPVGWLPGQEVECEVAPQCPPSVLTEQYGGHNVLTEASCCDGNARSHPISEYGVDETKQAVGFCMPENASDTTPCMVSLQGPGWRGCACRTASLPQAKTCTVECVPPDCPLKETGIPVTPDEWLTSEIPIKKPYNPALSGALVQAAPRGGALLVVAAARL